MKVKFKVVSRRNMPGVPGHVASLVVAPERDPLVLRTEQIDALMAAEIEIDLPDPPAKKTPGQMVYETETEAFGGDRWLPWSALTNDTRNKYHQTAFALGVGLDQCAPGAPYYEHPKSERTQQGATTQEVVRGRTFFHAYLNGGSYPTNWNTMTTPERGDWIARARAYELHRPETPRARVHVSANLRGVEILHADVYFDTPVSIDSVIFSGCRLFWRGVEVESLAELARRMGEARR